MTIILCDQDTESNVYADEEVTLIHGSWDHQSPQPLGTRVIAYATYFFL